VGTSTSDIPLSTEAPDFNRRFLKSQISVATQIALGGGDPLGAVGLQADEADNGLIATRPPEFTIQ
jgi:hypothetical protein